MEEYKFNGLFSIGHIKGGTAYLSELRTLAGVYTIDLTRFNECIKKQWDDRYNSVICFDSGINEISSDSNNISYIMLNTGYFTPDSQEPIYAGLFSYEPKSMDDPQIKWNGVEIGTRDSILKKWKGFLKKRSFTDFETVSYISKKANIYANICSILKTKYDYRISAENCREMIDKSYTQAINNDTFDVFYNKLAFFPLIIPDRPDLGLFIKAERNSLENKHPWFGAFIATKEELTEEIFNRTHCRIGDLTFDSIDSANDFVNSLADIAMAENWKWRSNEEKSVYDNPILRYYIEFTYYRLLEESKNQEDEKKKKLRIIDGKAYFNTGLLSRFFRQLFIVADYEIWDYSTKSMGTITHPMLSNADICKENDKKIITIFGNNPPVMASYFSKIEDVIFDASLKIIINDEHIFYDGLSRGRLPKYRSDYQSCNGVQKNIEELVEESIISEFNDAIHRAQLLAQRNYKLAVPQFWAETGEIQFLLPIYMSKTAAVPECALALSLVKATDTQEACYHGATILTLDMAYNNARLIAKPDVYWLERSQESTKAKDSTEYSENTEE